jgi:hypothetical protein
MTLPRQASPWRRWAVGGLASAAALLLGWVGVSRFVDHGPPSDLPDAGAIAQANLPTLEAEPGATLFIHIGGRTATAQLHPLAENSANDNVAVEHDVFNHMESLSSL